LKKKKEKPIINKRAGGEAQGIGPSNIKQNKNKRFGEDRKDKDQDMSYGLAWNNISLVTIM
jgi:hypothetical protein